MTVSTPERIAGCLLGGAVGDALGAAVEFMKLREIRAKFGPEGITHYAEAYGRLGASTDDTQMTLFTLEGLLEWLASGAKPTARLPALHGAYLRWLATQRGKTRNGAPPPGPPGGLLHLPAMNHRRAPGNTCLGALSSGVPGTIEAPVNDSKGCGGIMRAAPAGLLGLLDPFLAGCELAAITHGHPSGYLAAGFMAEAVSRLVAGEGLPEALSGARGKLAKASRSREALTALDRAVEAARAAEATPETIERLGAGWVAEEALAIAVFCAMKARDFAHGVRLAANHGGDSDSTGAITGNLLGALRGRGAIPAEFLETLELIDIIEEMADTAARARP